MNLQKERQISKLLPKMKKQPIFFSTATIKQQFITCSNMVVASGKQLRACFLIPALYTWPQCDVIPFQSGHQSHARAPHAVMPVTLCLTQITNTKHSRHQPLPPSLLLPPLTQALSVTTPLTIPVHFHSVFPPPQHRPKSRTQNTSLIV